MMFTLGVLPSFATKPTPCRDRFLEPFASTSIWNTAIGSKATYVPARLFLPDGPCGAPPCTAASSFHNDQDFFLRASPSDPLVPWLNQGDWGSDDHCVQHGAAVAKIPLPHNLTTASDGGRSVPGQPNNNAMGVLLLDNRSLVQMQPAYRCAPGAPLLARFGNSTDGCPQAFPNVSDILVCVTRPPAFATASLKDHRDHLSWAQGDGALGAHGGSGLSGVGGTIRLGELFSSAPIGHALKLELQHRASASWRQPLSVLTNPTVIPSQLPSAWLARWLTQSSPTLGIACFSEWYFGGHPLQPCSVYNQGRRQYVWPATGSDSGSDTTPNGLYRGTLPSLAPGALLAIPAAHASRVQTTTAIGGKIKEALVDYGGYLVDDTGAGNSAAICMHADVNAEMRSAVGYSMTYPHGVSAAPTDPGRALYDDLLALFQALHVVTTNGPHAVGGGGVPRQPTKPPICGDDGTPFVRADLVWI